MDTKTKRCVRCSETQARRELLPPQRASTPRDFLMIADKQCRRCREVKPLDAFEMRGGWRGANGGPRGSRQSHCKACPSSSAASSEPASVNLAALRKRPSIDGAGP